VSTPFGPDGGNSDPPAGELRESTGVLPVSQAGVRGGSKAGNTNWRRKRRESRAISKYQGKGIPSP